MSERVFEESRSRTPLILGIVLAVVAVVAIVAVVATSGDDDEADACPALDTPGSDSVTVGGFGLPQGEGADDPCIGRPVPALGGEDYAGNPTTITPDADGPMMIVVMAHWCPHCNGEVPLLVEWGESGNVPDGLQVVGVSTASQAGGEHYPPSTWIEEMGWEWPVLADDDEQTAAAALGTTGYPYLLFVDADGNVMFRESGELPIEDVQTLADRGRGHRRLRRAAQRHPAGTARWSVTEQSAPNSRKRSKPRRNQRSWVTATTVPVNWARPCSSASADTRSRLSVGSSSSSSVAPDRSSRRIWNRACWPPDNVSNGCSAHPSRS